MSIQEREITKTVMVEVLVCDQCGKIGPERVSGLTPRATGWICVKHDTDDSSYHAMAETFCSWKCVADYADDKNTKREGAA